MAPDRTFPHDDSLRAEEFDALVRVLLPTVRSRQPALTEVEALREASQLAERHLRETGWISWGPPRI